MATAEMMRAKRLRDRIAGMRYAMKTQRLTPMKLAETEKIIQNMESAAEEIERRAKKPR
ncbi:MAG: hypothetical protein KJ904_01745 [Alphaproteobacteria bacterium]|nr:hypothetical protein [Alphaproteobacteria bacterium]MBU0797819.1 hypothetical protein [Alphaproteobacteria bacterium]MBU0885860.1 hypothetical protein [Alphaproteobacteria bacterium]MBU1814589.1 hypothetical protein [Alphaproteobacteria bacterium]MBU2089499.1 hypothetical protein [Alphaproteobacteria bacterium]